ncbi:MAG: hypothetical protein WBB18_00030, partial [Nodosilinea sp.]
RGRLFQSSSEDFCDEPWNSIPGRSARLSANPQRLAPLTDRPHRFAGCVALPNSPMGGVAMADTPNPGIEMAGLKAHVPARGRLFQSSSEDFCDEPWNSIPGQSARLTANPQRLAISPGGQA